MAHATTSERSETKPNVTVPALLELAVQSDVVQVNVASEPEAAEVVTVMP